MTRANIKLNNNTIDNFNVVDAIQQGRGTGNLLRSGVEIETVDPKWNWNSDKLLKYPPHPPEVKLDAFSSAKKIVHDSKGTWERIDGLSVSLTSIIKKMECLLEPKGSTSDETAKRHFRMSVEEFEEFIAEQKTKNPTDRSSLSTWLQNRHCPTGKDVLIPDLSEQKISGLELAGVDLSGTIFDHAELSDITVSDSNLSHASFEATSFRRVTFSNSILVHTIFRDSAFHATDSISGESNRSHLSKKLVRDMRVRKIAYLDLQLSSLRSIMSKVGILFCLLIASERTVSCRNEIYFFQTCPSQRSSRENSKKFNWDATCTSHELAQEGS